MPSYARLMELLGFASKSAVKKVLAQKDIIDIWTAQGADPGGQTPAEFAKFQRAEIEKWAKVVKEAGVKLDL